MKSSTITKLLQRYKNLNKQKEKDEKAKIEESFCNHIEQLVDNKNFYSLNFNDILTIIEKVNFKGKSDFQTLITKLISNLNKFYPNKTGLLLNSIKLGEEKLDFESCISILKEFTTCDLLVNLVNEYNNNQMNVDYDWEYDSQQKEKQIKKLNEDLDLLNKKIQMLSANQIIYPPIKFKPWELKQDVFESIQKNDIQSLRWYIEKENVDVNSRNSENETLLHIAMEELNESAIFYLLDKGADANAISGEFDKHILEIASDYIPQIIPCLVSRGADPNYTYNLYYKSKTILYRTILYRPSFFAVDLLIECGADVNSINDYNDTTALHFAAENGDFNLVKLLLHYGADPDIEDYYGFPPESKDPQIDQYLKSLRKRKHRWDISSKTQN